MTRRDFITDAAIAGAASVSLGAFAADGAKLDRGATMALFDAHRDETEARVSAGIEQNRKGDFSLRIAAADGRPFDRAHVRIKQLKHDFKYGANLFLLGEIGDERREAIYEEAYRRAFNCATLAFYWNDLEPEQGKPRYGIDAPKLYRRPPTDLCVDWCVRHGIYPKVHCLYYPKYQPDWVKSSVAREKELLEKRFRELSERYASRVPMWEVTNECFLNGAWEPALYLDPDMIEWVYKLAARYFPNNKLISNDDFWHRARNFLGTRSDYYLMVENALLKGCRVDGVGLQLHLFKPAKTFAADTRYILDPRRMFGILDTFARLNRPLQMTELTIPAYSANARDEALQAELLRTLYSIWFSHPAMEAIIYWNVVDGYAAGERGDMTSRQNAYYGGLLRYDMTPKPVYEMINELFGRTWHTEFERDSGSTCAFRGFYGTYRVGVTVNGRDVVREIRFSRGAESAEIMV